jgi:hypothetical protein
VIVAFVIFKSNACRDLTLLGRVEEVILEGSLKVERRFHDCRTQVLVSGGNSELFVLFQSTKGLSVFGVQIVLMLEMARLREGESRRRFKLVHCRSSVRWSVFGLPSVILDVEHELILDLVIRSLTEVVALNISRWIWSSFAKVRHIDLVMRRAK